MPLDDAATTAAADQRTALDPSTDPQVLAGIAQHRPDLRPAVAMNPATYPALLEWLANLDDPVINASLTTRTTRTTTPTATPAPMPVPTPVSTATPVSTPSTSAATPSSGAARLAHTTHHRGPLIGVAAGVLVLASVGYLAAPFIDTSPDPGDVSACELIANARNAVNEPANRWIAEGKHDDSVYRDQIEAARAYPIQVGAALDKAKDDNLTVYLTSLQDGEVLTGFSEFEASLFFDRCEQLGIDLEVVNLKTDS